MWYEEPPDDDPSGPLVGDEAAAKAAKASADERTRSEAQITIEVERQERAKLRILALDQQINYLAQQRKGLNEDSSDHAHASLKIVSAANICL